MLRPIDTQIVYQQTQDVAAREQLQKQAQIMQQEQFSDLLKKEVHNKQDKINEMQKGERVDNDLNKNKKKQQNQEQHSKEQKNKSTKTPEKKSLQEVKHTSIDIRI